MEIVQSDHDFIHAANRYHLSNAHRRRGGLHQDRHPGPAPHAAYESRDFIRRAEIRQHQLLRTEFQRGLDLILAPWMNWIEARESSRTAQTRGDMRQVWQLVIGDEGVQPRLPLALAETFDIDADPVDSGAIGGR